jgi:hypothetical protein
MEELTEVITAAAFHPTQCQTLMYVLVGIAAALKLHARAVLFVLMGVICPII